MGEGSVRAPETAVNSDVVSPNHPTFNSFGEFVRELGEVLRLGWRERKSLRAMNPRFRETVSLAVTFANHCRV